MLQMIEMLIICFNFLKWVISYKQKGTCDERVALPCLPCNLFPFPEEGRCAITSSECMEYRKCLWCPFLHAGTDFIDTANATQRSISGQSCCRSKNWPIRMTRISVSTDRTRIFLAPSRNACMTWTSILVSASSCVQSGIFWPVVFETTSTPFVMKMYLTSAWPLSILHSLCQTGK